MESQTPIHSNISKPSKIKKALTIDIIPSIAKSLQLYSPEVLATKQRLSELWNSFSLSYDELKAMHPPSKFYKFPFEDGPYWTSVCVLLAPLSNNHVSSIDQLLLIFQKISELDPDSKWTEPRSLKKMLSKLSEEEHDLYLKKIFPQIAKLALKLPVLFEKTQIPISAQNFPNEVTLTKEQCASLLANMFFGTLLFQENFDLHEEFSFSLWITGGVPHQTAKLRCLLSYFKRLVTTTIPNENITFKRVCYEESLHGGILPEHWAKDASVLSDVEYHESKSILDFSHAIQVDFANKFLGGGVLGYGCVQEELMFTEMPECIVGMLFSEYMLPHEAICIIGAERYCKGTGYGSEFEFEEEFEDKRKVDAKGRKDSCIVAIDAIAFDYWNLREQLEPENFMRDLNKAYVGFSLGISQGGLKAENELKLIEGLKDEVQGIKEELKEGSGSEKKAVATGKWGCGVFNGDKRVKFVVQWLAASRAKRRMIFSAFGDRELGLAKDVAEKWKGRSVGEVFEKLRQIETIDWEKDGLFGYLMKE